MLFKISKNRNATLYSDIEERGKGKRVKKSVKHFDDSDKEADVMKERKVQSTTSKMLPPLPKLTNVSKPEWRNNLLFDPVDKIERSYVDTASSSIDNNEERHISVSHDINVLREIAKNQKQKTTKNTILKNKDDMGCKEVASSERSFSMETYKSESTEISSEVCSSKRTLSVNGCKTSSKIHKKCSYTVQGEVTLESLADAICHLNGTSKI